jgi:hypothetical protein
MIVGLVVKSTSASVSSPEPRWPVRGSRFMRYTRPWSVSPGQGHRAYGNAKPPDLCRPSFGSGNGNSLAVCA